MSRNLILCPANLEHSHLPLEARDIPELLQQALRDVNPSVEIPNLEDFYRRYPILRPEGYQEVPTVHRGVPATIGGAPLHHPRWQEVQSLTLAAKTQHQAGLVLNEEVGSSSRNPGRAEVPRPRITSSDFLGRRNQTTTQQTALRAEGEIAGIRRSTPHGVRIPTTSPNNDRPEITTTPQNMAIVSHSSHQL